MHARQPGRPRSTASSKRFSVDTETISRPIVIVGRLLSMCSLDIIQLLSPSEVGVLKILVWAPQTHCVTYLEGGSLPPDGFGYNDFWVVVLENAQ